MKNIVDVDGLVLYFPLTIRFTVTLHTDVGIRDRKLRILEHKGNRH